MQPISEQRRRSSLGAAGIPVVVLTLTLAAAAATSFEREALSRINDYRQTQGRATLSMNQTLYRLAKAHSDRMAAQSRLSHEGFQQRFVQSGFSACVENVAWNHQTPESLVGAWRQSSHHNANLLKSNMRAAGLARTGAYITFLACGEASDS